MHNMVTAANHNMRSLDLSTSRSDRLLITFPLHESTVKALKLVTGEITEAGGLEILYKPEIALSQRKGAAPEAPANDLLAETLTDFKPHVLMIGNNTVSEDALRRWNGTLGARDESTPAPLIIRRGIELGGVPLNLAKSFGIAVRNIPGINSPYVARHMARHLGLAPFPGERAPLEEPGAAAERIAEIIPNNLGFTTPSTI